MWTEVRRYSRCFQDFKPRIKSSLQGPYRLILCTDLPVWKTMVCSRWIGSRD
ncbi:hypothetical protein HanRHA438_Chr17g0801381 [Helianthus annuus]|nr:hypothetical protein HanXRQr2_Chr17g0791041 [Helianthus annuus]KAJ0428332.1 hypothetical protein HanHA300_Chr17g0644881 [Helianthus annuus]KAJ0432385.1 hypothetical protein HanIR_Chr17g0858591 [Helianthus annuus]KAJ0446650.1 hypothetical protein HanHA89_Chr17g0696551 [Helianthus annuus]KAJ0631568.1 hypothetical protein HanLR1_Chr17g0655361 [Helianthus annuus]